jgi:hypothetical protein
VQELENNADEKIGEFEARAAETRKKLISMLEAQEQGAIPASSTRRK